MAKYVLEKGFPKKDLASEDHEGLLLALATAIYVCALRKRMLVFC